ncbi:Gfo/Idh/MocA family protein [Nibricoccus sp. IMCC34717]|uniref:Gfo/Idh/MocA family protein n=1 Tax=Nibricoccus sp. IMCC34717 TaxID=3034021 RepID=UPI0038505522
MPTPRLAIIGMGGFAGAHHDAVLKLEERKLARLVATCDPRRRDFITQRDSWRFAQRGVRVYDDYRSMLEDCARDLDAVLIPTPVHLHPEMHAAVIAHGLCAFVEKPATLDPVEFERMLERDRGAPRPTAVGFNGITDRTRRTLKQRLLAGDFGRLEEARVTVFWPRPRPYFTRAPWASQLVFDGHLILDSLHGNAMAHALHSVLFSAGQGALDSWATPTSVQAELYRVHPGPAADTAFISIGTEEGTRLRIALSHACHGQSVCTETLVCERATLRLQAGQSAEIADKNGRTQVVPADTADPLAENLVQFLQYLGGQSDRPPTLLSECRSHLTVNGLAYVSSGGITPLGGDYVELFRDPREQIDYHVIPSLSVMASRFTQQGEWPGAVWKGSNENPPIARPADLPRLRSVLGF